MVKGSVNGRIEDEIVGWWVDLVLVGLGKGIARHLFGYARASTSIGS